MRSFSTLRKLVQGNPTASEFSSRLQESRLSLVESQVSGGTVVSSLDIDNVEIWTCGDLAAGYNGLFEVGFASPVLFILKQVVRAPLISGSSCSFSLFTRNGEPFSLVLKLNGVQESMYAALCTFFCTSVALQKCSPFVHRLCTEADRLLHLHHLLEQHVHYAFLITRHDAIIQPSHLLMFGKACESVILEFLQETTISCFCTDPQVPSEERRNRRSETGRWLQLSSVSRLKKLAKLLRTLVSGVKTHLVVAIGKKIDDENMLREILLLHLGESRFFASPLVKVEVHFAFVYTAVRNRSRAAFEPNMVMIDYERDRENRVENVLPEKLTGVTVFPGWFAGCDNAAITKIKNGDFGAAAGPSYGSEVKAARESFFFLFFCVCFFLKKNFFSSIS